MELKIVFILFLFDFGLCNIIQTKKQPESIVIDDIKVEPIYHSNSQAKKRHTRQAWEDVMEYDYETQMWRPKSTQAPPEAIPNQVSENTGPGYVLNSANNYGIDPNETATGIVVTPATITTSAPVEMDNQPVTPVPNTNPGNRRPRPNQYQNSNNYLASGGSGTAPENGANQSDWQINFPASYSQGSQQGQRPAQTDQNYNQYYYRPNRQNYNNYYSGK